jgi:hypothetical protein
MERYEIPWLRSPSPHHPHPNANALRQFAQARQRSRQLEGPYGLPHTDLFADFCLKAFHAEPCMWRRQRQVQEARDGGSITPETAAQLSQAQRGGALQLHEQCEVRSARWRSDQWTVLCTDGHGLEVDRIWRATGHRQGVSQQPLLRQLQDQRPIDLVNDWPVLACDLSWPGSAVHVMGGLTALQLGPASRNLCGGREAARRICRAVIHQ